MNLIGNINAIPFRRFRGGGGVAPIPPFPSISGIIARYSALGLTNEQMAENPVWKDLTGNGYDLQMKNFGWAGMSGVNGYVENYNGGRWIRSTNRADMTWTSYSVNITSVKIASAQLYYQSYLEQPSFIVSSYTIRVQGLKDGQTLSYRHQVSGEQNIYRIIEDGIYTLPSFLFKANGDWYGFQFNKVQESCDITIEQLPLYPGALVFDGVDDYGVCENFPILTKEKGYTVVALRQWITRGEIASGLVSNVKDWFNDGAFLLEYRNIQAEHLNKPISFGAIGSEMDLPHILTYQTSKSYNGVSITTGNFEGTDVLHVGKLAPTNVGTCINAAIWELVFLDHDATEEELTKIKDYFVKTYPWFFPDQAWTVVGKTNEDEDRATIANITGNGNDLVLSNFAFSGNSGYGSYVYNFNDTSTWLYYPYNGTIEITSSTIHVTEAKTARPFFEKKASSGGYNKVKIKVTGIKDGEILKFMSDEDRDNTINIEKDGIYSLPGSDKLYYGFRLSNSTNTYPFNCDITIEQIPEYEGYLITDGVDDKIESKQPFQLPIKFSMIGSWVFIKKEDKRAGISKENNLIVYDKITGLTLFLNSVESYEEIDIDSFHAISSDGKLYDENWNMLPITVGSLLSDSSTLKIAYDGNNFAQFAFNCMGFYDKILKKDDLLKGWIYLKGLKAQRIPPSKNYILKEDGGYVLQEDGIPLSHNLVDLVGLYVEKF